VSVRHRRDQTDLACLFQPIAVALDHQRVAVMQELIEDCRCEDLVAEDGAPLRDQLIGRDQQAAALVASGDELEEEMRLRRSNGK
jgi:hypothetical protein